MAEASLQQSIQATIRFTFTVASPSEYVAIPLKWEGYLYTLYATPEKVQIVTEDRETLAMEIMALSFQVSYWLHFEIKRDLEDLSLVEMVVWLWHDGQVRPEEPLIGLYL